MFRSVLIVVVGLAAAACQPKVGEGKFRCDPEASNRCPAGYRCLPFGPSFFCLTEEEGVCGNGLLEAGEQCDATELPDEVCDQLGQPGGHAYCIFPVCAVYCSKCGNGIVDVGEECDDTNTTAGDGCGPTCLLERCGNGYIDPGEECDNGPLNSDSAPGGCSLSCRGETITVVVDGEGMPSIGLAVGSDAVYWTNFDLGSVMKAPLSGGAPVLLASGQVEPGRLAVDSTHVYWVDRGGGVVMKVPQEGGVPTALASGQSGPSSLAVDATHVYWGNENGGQVMKVALTGGPPVVLASEQERPSNIAVGPTYVYWTTEGSWGELMRVPLAGGAESHFATLPDYAAALAVDSTHVYWVTVEGVGKKPHAGGAAVTLASGWAERYGLEVDSTYAYWLAWSPAPEEAALMRVGLGGGEPEVRIGGLMLPQLLALGATHIYWANIQGQILGIEKRP